MKKKEEMVQQSFALNRPVLDKIIHHLLHEKVAFVLYKKPNKDDIFLQVSNSTHTDTFVLNYFDNTQKCFIHGVTYTNDDITSVLNARFNATIAYSYKVSNAYTSKVDYVKYVKRIVEDCTNGKIKKCVAARKIKAPLPSSFSLASTFLNACHLYQHAFIHLSHTNFGLWLGASPELLLEQKGSCYSTVALAGTKTIEEGRDWTAKEIEEQKMVSDFILSTLQKCHIKNINQSETYTNQSGHLQHLKTDIDFVGTTAQKYLDALHPTPAVCGTPTEIAKRIIQAEEKYNRTFYTGYLGKSNDNGFYYVNLRCMQLFKNHADVYVGAGITQYSNALDEWLETENKAQVMIKILKKI